MEEQLIGFETAVLAKEKGFKLGSGWQIRSLYNLKDGEIFCEKTRETSDYACERCTQSLLQRWLREVHGVYISPMFIGPHTNKHQYRIDIKESGNLGEYSTWYDTHEQALEAGLYKGLTLIK